MSAWLCSDEFIAQIVCAGMHGNHSVDSIASAAGFYYDDRAEARVDQDGFASAIALILRAENYRSLYARYGDRSFWSPLEEQAPPFKITLGQIEQARRIPLGYALKMLDCLQYQSCEARDWTETRAFKICDAIRGNLSSRVEGYNTDGAWGDPFPFAAPAPELIGLTKLARAPRKGKPAQ
jgi:hypothetical protein